MPTEPAPQLSPELARRARGLRALLTDVDGVLTDGLLRYGASGEEIKAFSVRDGLALKLAREAGLVVGLLSARSHEALIRRADELGLDEVMLGRGDKGHAFNRFLAERGLGASEVAFVGDDLPDLPVLARCGLSFCPSDAAREVQAHCDVVVEKPGGRGAVREAVEMLLNARGQWRDLLANFLPPS